MRHRTRRPIGWLTLAVALTLGSACRSETSPAPEAGEALSETPSEPEEAPDEEATGEAPSGDAEEGAEAPLVGPDEVRAQLEALAESGPTEHWYGVYLMGRKVGHARMWLGPSGEDRPGRVATGTDVAMTVKGPTGATDMELRERRFYGGEPPYPLVETRFAQETPLSTQTRRAVARGDALVVETLGEDGEVESSKRLPATRETLADLLATMPVYLDSLEPGRKTSVYVFDWQSEGDTPVDLEVESVESVRRAGVDTRVATLRTRYRDMGLTARSRVAEGGVVLETTLGPGLSLRLEEQEVAKSGVEGLDVMRAGAPIDRRLGDPRDLDRLVLRVDLAAGAEATLPSDGRQAVKRLEDGGWRVELRRGDIGPVGEAERDEALGSDGTIDADVESIRERAASLVEDVSGDRERAKRLAAWVHGALRKELATHIPSASEVLERKVGDCTEHTWLFVALARAAGLPARPVFGLMYLDGPEPRFGYHAWAEVAVDGRWIPVDPTWNRMPVDPTHLALGYGMYEVANAMGGLRIEVLEVESPEE
ncbi:MAG: transglutaminase-like domain-containing protein [Myxococcota bacterium]